MGLLFDIGGAVVVGFVVGFFGHFLLPSFLVGPLAIVGSLAFLGWRKDWFQDENQSEDRRDDADI